MSTEEIYNAIKVNDRLVTAGQPTEDQLAAAKTEGFATVINLAPSDSRNALADEAGTVRALGMNYNHIPVQWDDPQQSDFTAFEQAMEQRPEGKTLIHCAANFRATAFYSLYAQKHLGWTEAQAEQFRSQIWTNDDNLVWKAFIAEIEAQITK